MEFTEKQPWPRQIAARLGILWPLKAMGTMAFMALFFWGYFSVLRHPLAPVTVMPLTLLDSWLPFMPAAFPAYASLWVYVSLPPALIGNLRALLLFGGWMAALCLFCLAIFWIFPTAVPAQEIDWTRYPEMALLKGLDASGNACPSLHVATAVFSGIWLHRLFRVTGTPVWLNYINGVQCLLILWSTIATRQHVVLDVAAGIIVGNCFALLSLRHIRRVKLPL